MPGLHLETYCTKGGERVMAGLLVELVLDTRQRMQSDVLYRHEMDGDRDVVEGRVTDEEFIHAAGQIALEYVCRAQVKRAMVIATHTGEVLEVYVKRGFGTPKFQKSKLVPELIVVKFWDPPWSPLVQLVMTKRTVVDDDGVEVEFVER